MMRNTIRLVRNLGTLAAVVALTVSLNTQAAAHCDTLDGPVVQDARKALTAGDVTPVLKWVQAKDEKAVKDAFGKALAARGKKQQESAEKKFFESLFRIHRAGDLAIRDDRMDVGGTLPVPGRADLECGDHIPGKRVVQILRLGFHEHDAHQPALGVDQRTSGISGRCRRRKAPIFPLAVFRFRRL